MRLARYHHGGLLQIESEPDPTCPPGGLLVQTEACGLCSGELMTWYLDRKAPHVLGHEVAGRVIESQDERFPVGVRIFPHHHAPCLECDACQRGHTVHCAQWKRTRLDPGGMSTCFGVPAENLNDTLIVEDLRAQDAALIEPLACVMKSLKKLKPQCGDRVLVIGLGVMGLMHLLASPGQAVGTDLNPRRMEWATSLGLQARAVDPCEQFDAIVVCPGSRAAFEFALSVAAPEARILFFAPLPPEEQPDIDWNAVYFRDLTLSHAYSCGPEETRLAVEVLRNGIVKAEQVVSHFIELDELPAAYQTMKKGEILKPMVLF